MIFLLAVPQKAQRSKRHEERCTFTASCAELLCLYTEKKNFTGVFLRDAKMKYHKISRSGSIDGLNFMNK